MVTIIYMAAIKQGDIAFGRKAPTILKAQFPKCTFFDFDNYSEALMGKYANELAEKAEKLLVVAEIDVPEKTQSFIPFCNKLLRTQKDIPVVMKGDEPTLAKMLKAAAKNRFFQVDDEQELLERASTLLKEMTTNL